MHFNVCTLVLVAALAPVKETSFLHVATAVKAKDTPTVKHDKEAGGGYQPGSPLYERQEGLEAGAGEPVKKFTAETMPAVSTTMQCVINLAVQYFLIYTAVAIARTINDFSGASSSPTLTTLSAACGTVAYAPMLCVLFLGTRMRAIQLTQGDPDAHDLPQPYVKGAMQCCAWAVLGQTLLVLALPVVLGQTPTIGSDGTPEVRESGQEGVMKWVAKGLGAARWVFMAALYGGFTAVCVGAATMEAPTSIYPDGAPPVSPAVACTMNLSMQYFFVYLAIAVIQTWEQFGTRSELTHKLGGIFHLATNTVNFAPMLCVLFIGARMRALQMDPKNGNPQAWAQNCFYLCTYSVMVQLALVILVPLALGGKVVKGESEGDVTFELPNPTLFWALSAFRYAVMLSLYGGFTAVIVSVNIIEAKDGATTPPVSPAMQCVMNLTVQYFFVYLLLWVFLTLKQLSMASLQPFLRLAIPTMEAAKGTVIFCPMLSVLFIGLRMRALQITSNEGSPQGFAQQGMFISTYCVLVQILMVLLLPVIMGEPAKVDEDGNVVSKPGNVYAGYAVSAIRYLALIGVYGGAVSCVVALFQITPETANGSGSLIPGVTVPTPPAVPGQAGSFF